MVYITGDIHGAFDIHKINPDEFIPGRTLTSDDYVIICGDFGCIWDGGSSDRFWLNWLESLPWNTVFIDGNHENFDVLNSYPVEEWKGGKVHRIRSNIFHLMRGEVFEIDGKKWLAMGGAFSHDAAYRTENKNWWKAEMPTLEEARNARKNLEKHNYQVDYVLSHDIYSSHPLAKTFENDMNLYRDDQVNIQDILEEIRQKTEYKTWFNGHYHKDVIYEDCDQRKCFTLYNNVENLDDIHPESFVQITELDADHAKNYQTFQ